MTLGDLGSLGEIVGAVAALAYLALQIRQNTEALRVNSYHQATAGLARLLDAIWVEAEAWENAFQNAWPLFARPGIAQFGSRRKGSVSERFGHYRRTYGQSAAQRP